MEEGQTGVGRSIISLEEREFRSCGEGLRIDHGVANGTLCDYNSPPISCRRLFLLDNEDSCLIHGHMPPKVR